jgi:NTF2-related export protein 1/2
LHYGAPRQLSIPAKEPLTNIIPAATAFINHYYPALNTKRGILSSFYILPTPLAPQVADISLNGNLVSSPSELQILFETQMPKAHYEAQSYDCQVLNPNYNIGAIDADLAPDTTGRKMSLLLVVSGYVKYGEAREAKMRGFTENFILVPNMDRAAERKWLIQSQNFRMLV